LKRGRKRKRKAGDASIIPLAEITPQTKQVLALLVVAALQKSSFEDGWIAVEDLKRYTSLGEKPDNLRAALGRALRELKNVREVLIGKDKRNRRLYARIISPISGVLREWLKSVGKNSLPASSYDRLLATPTTVGLDRASVFGITEALVMGSSPASAENVLHGLSVRDMFTFIEEPIDASNSDEWCHLARLTFLRIEAVLARGGPRQVSAARNELEELLACDVKVSDSELILVEAQACIMIARTILAQAMMEHPGWPLDERLVAECREWLKKAEEGMSNVPSIDRGYALALEGLICVHEGSLPPFPHPDLFADAATLFEQALQQFRSCRHLPGMVEVFHYETERAYQNWSTTPDPFGTFGLLVQVHFGIAQSLFDAVETVYCNDLRTIERARMALFPVILATSRATRSDTPEIVELLRTARKELRSLCPHVTPKTAPFVAHANARLREHAKVFGLSKLLSLDAPKSKESRPRK